MSSFRLCLSLSRIWLICLQSAHDHFQGYLLTLNLQFKSVWAKTLGTGVDTHWQMTAIALWIQKLIVTRIKFNVLYCSQQNKFHGVNSQNTLRNGTLYDVHVTFDLMHTMISAGRNVDVWMLHSGQAGWENLQLRHACF